MRSRSDKLPFEAVDRFLGEQLSLNEAAARFGVGTTKVKRWRRYGLNDAEADKLACRTLGVHPVVIWGDQWWALATSVEEGDDMQ